MKEIFKRHLAAFDASDWNAHKADLAPDFEYEEVATGRRSKGDDFIATMKQWKAAFPDAKTTVKHYYEAGDTIVAEVEWQATHKGALETAFGTLPASNKGVRLGGVLIYKAKDGKLIGARSYFDLMSLFRQLGVTTAIGAAAGKPEAEKRVTA
jgi:steroid delta-isomerase-like uncharacterized protein